MPQPYFSGRNNGVAEEITLKTNEITRKKSSYLEGTYAVHGIEEVLGKQDVIRIILNWQWVGICLLKQKFNLVLIWISQKEPEK